MRPKKTLSVSAEGKQVWLGCQSGHHLRVAEKSMLRTCSFFIRETTTRVSQLCKSILRPHPSSRDAREGCDATDRRVRSPPRLRNVLDAGTRNSPLSAPAALDGEPPAAPPPSPPPPSSPPPPMLPPTPLPKSRYGVDRHAAPLARFGGGWPRGCWRSVGTPQRETRITTRALPGVKTVQTHDLRSSRNNVIDGESRQKTGLKRCGMYRGTVAGFLA